MKLLSLGALALTFAAVRDPRLLPMMLAASLTLCLLARLPLRFVFSRLKYPLVFVLLLALALPFVYGETVLVSLGSFSVYREGSLELLKTTAKMASILAVGLVFLGTTTQARTFETMRALGMPTSLANMMLACCPYLSEIGGTLTKLRRAARIESPEATRPDSRMLLTIASITRSTLVRGAGSFSQGLAVGGKLPSRTGQRPNLDTLDGPK